MSVRSNLSLPESPGVCAARLSGGPRACASQAARLERLELWSPLKQSACHIAALGMQNGDQSGEEGCCGEGVEPIHQSAVAGNEAARILDAETPLERGFEQIAKLGHDRRREAEPEQRREAVCPRRENEADDGP